MTTYFPSADAARAQRQWWLIDASDVPLGRLGTIAANLLTGKNKAAWTPFMDTGDFVVVINCEKALLTGRKEQRKIYSRHTGYPGGFKQITAEKLRARNPVHMVEEAIRGMVPKTRLGRAMSKKLKVYTGTDHPHGAQAPTTVDVEALRRRSA